MRTIGLLAVAATAWWTTSGSASADLVFVVAEPMACAAIAEWKDFREAQGHRILTLEPTQLLSGSKLDGARRAGERVVVLLIGDGEGAGVPPLSVGSHVLRRYGPEAELATDLPYAEQLGADHVARIPINDPAALRRYLRRVIDRERAPATWGDLRLQLAAGAGGFSPLVDGAIEGAAASLVQRLAPPTASLSLKRYPVDSIGANQRGPVERGGVMVWMGHGHRSALPGVPDSQLTDICCGADIAVLIACYTGDFGAAGECVAERLLNDSHGPVAVITATRVTMPYGNARLGAELLLGIREGGQANLGQLMNLARRRSVGEDSAKELRGLEQLASLVGADPSLLGAEREEHALVYHLLGDPLLSVHRTTGMAIDAPSVVGKEESLLVRGRAPHAGSLEVELLKPGDTSGRRPLHRLVVEAGEPFEAAFPADASWRSGRRRIRVGVAGPSGVAVGVAEVVRRGEVNIPRTAAAPVGLAR